MNEAKNGNNEKKKIDFWTALGRLPFYERLIILGSFVAVGVLLFAGIYKVINTSHFTKFHFPDSVLSQAQKLQTYKQSTYTGLGLLVQFPTTDYGCYVGTREYKTSANAASFLYDTDDYIITGVIDPKNFSQSEFYDYAVPMILGYTVSEDFHYTSKIYDKGYLNTFEVEYEGGICSLGNEELYLVSYLYPVGEKKLCMMVVTDKKDTNKLKQARTLLNKVYFSLLRFEDATLSGNTQDVFSDVIKNNPTSEGVASAAESAAPSEDVNTESEDEALERIDRELEEKNYHLEYPDATELVTNVYVGDNLAGLDTVIYIWYEEFDSIPKEAYLTSPLGKTYKPDYVNKEYNGLVFWNIKNPSVGEWVVHLSANTRYGAYKADALELHDFTNFFIARDDDDVIPHSMDD